MKRFFLPGAAMVLGCTAAWGQTPAAKPKATPVPRPSFVEENQILQNGSFELPRVAKRTPLEELPSLRRLLLGEWASFAPNAAAKGSGFTAGVTNEIARGGHQSLYFDFQQVKKPVAYYSLISGLLPVKPGSPYHVSIWGRLDARHPPTLDQRMPILRLQVEFFQEDAETQTGDPSVKVQPIPGVFVPNRPIFFAADRWTEYYSDETSPMDAAYIRISWTIGTPQADGESNGTIYLDDAAIGGELVPVPDPDAAPDENAKPTVPAPPEGAAGTKEPAPAK